MATAAAATADADVATDVTPKKGKKKLIIILAAVLLLVLAGGGAAVYVIKKRAAAAAAAAEEDGGEVDTAAAAEARRKERAQHPPTFVPLEPFVVNLADKESDRFAQIGVTLEVEDAHFADELKAYMPAIRSGILMVLSHKTSEQLLSPEGKLALAREIMRESVLPLGIEVSAAEPAQPRNDDAGDGEDGGDGHGKPKKSAGMENPVKRVHFSNFIVQ